MIASIRRPSAAQHGFAAKPLRGRLVVYSTRLSLVQSTCYSAVFSVATYGVGKSSRWVTGPIMGAEIYPTFNPNVPSARFDADGKQLLREIEALDELSASAQLPPISSFADNRPIPDNFDGHPEDLVDILGEWDEWFSVDDGLRAIDGLIAMLKSDADARSKLEEPEYVLGDLECLASSLRTAREHHAEFRLEVG